MVLNWQGKKSPVPGQTNKKNLTNTQKKLLETLNLSLGGIGPPGSGSRFAGNPDGAETNK
jgi:hypothetical protein